MKKYLDFSQEFGKVDEELIAEAGKPGQKREAIFSGCTGEKSVRQQQSFWLLSQWLVIRMFRRQLKNLLQK